MTTHEWERGHLERPALDALLAALGPDRALVVLPGETETRARVALRRLDGRYEVPEVKR